MNANRGFVGADLVQSLAACALWPATLAPTSPLCLWPVVRSRIPLTTPRGPNPPRAAVLHHHHRPRPRPRPRPRLRPPPSSPSPRHDCVAPAHLAPPSVGPCLAVLFAITACTPCESMLPFVTCPALPDVGPRAGMKTVCLQQPCGPCGLVVHKIRQCP